MTTVFGTLRGPGQRGEPGRIDVRAVGLSLRTDGVDVLGADEFATADDGSWARDLLPNTTDAPYYVVSATTSTGFSRQYLITVPTSASPVPLTAIQVNLPLPKGVTPALRGPAGQRGEPGFGLSAAAVDDQVAADLARAGSKTQVAAKAASLAAVTEADIFAERGLAPANALRLPGAGNYVTTPDSPAVSITGSIDLRIRVAVDSFTAAVNQNLINKYQAAGDQRAYRFFIDTTGRLAFAHSTDGTNAGAGTLATSTAPVPSALAGKAMWLRATLDAPGNLTTYYTSADGSNWTVLGSPIAQAGATSTFDSSSALFIGQTVDNQQPLIGTVYAAEIRNGIDGPVVASFDAGLLTAAGDRTPTTLAQGGPWTVVGPSWSWIYAYPAPVSAPKVSFKTLGVMVNVKDFAATEAQRYAVGNGASKPLSGFYSSLAAAQADYPLVTSLSEELDNAVITAAMDYARVQGGGLTYAPRGVYALTQLVIPRLVHLKGESWTSFGNNPNEGTTLRHVTAQTVDMIRWGVDASKFIGQGGLTDFVLRGHPQSTAGRGVHTLSPTGDKGKFQDMVTVERLLIRGFADDGLLTYGGSPLRIRDIQTIWNEGVGMRIVDDGLSGAAGSVQHVMLEAISGDGNKGGASVRFEGLQNVASVTLISMKGEQRENFDRGGVDAQPNVLQFHNCAMPVTILGISNISEGRSNVRPGDLISVTGTAKPAISYSGAGVRVLPTQTVGPMPNLITDGTTTIPLSPADGQYPRRPGTGRDSLVIGEGNMERSECNAATLTTGSGSFRARCFTARTATTINTMRVVAGTTAGTGTTLVRMGLYLVDSAGLLGALVCSTPNDATLLAATNTPYSKAVSAPYTLIPGQRYALGLLVVTTGTPPTVVGNGVTGGSSAVAGLPPLMSGQVGSLTDLPAAGATLGGSAIGPYIEMLP